MENETKFLKGFFIGLGSAVFCILLAAGLFLFSVGGSPDFLRAEEPGSAVGEDEEEGQNLQEKIQEIEGVIDQHYLDEVDKNDLADGVYTGLVDGLGDPYSVYYNEEELSSMLEATSGSYYGIGATMSQNSETGIITVVTPFEGAPAAEAGILPGDILYKVGEIEVTGMDLTSVVAMIKGEEGTTVDLTVVREDADDYLEFTVGRRQIEVPTVAYELLEDQIGYIQISEFDDVTKTQFKEALDELEEQGMQALVIDLRSNPGGVLSVVCNMLEQILPEGLIVYTEDKYGNRDEYTSSGENEFTKPLAVLVNGNSASASEIFAGAVKDYGIGTIVGTTTFGKGIVQKIFNLSDGTAVKLTISKYYTPNGNNIHDIGIEPDVEVELDEELRKQISISYEEDNQLQAAIEVLLGTE